MVEADDARISDETLIGRTAAGDASAFGRLVRRHQGAVYRFIRATAPPDGRLDLPEEILYETFAAARRMALRYRDEASARTWLLALARRAIDRRYPRTPQEGRESDATPLRELASLAGQGSLVENGVITSIFEALPPEDREILTLCDREYFTVDEAARVTGLSESVVRTRLHRARLRLLARWKKEEDTLAG